MARSWGTAWSWNGQPDQSSRMATSAPVRDDLTAPVLPAVALPIAGGAVRGLGEKFTANPVTGSASVSVPLAATAGRSGVSPSLSITYDSAAGQGVFGFGWQLNLASITRQTERGLPRYADADDSDTFLLSGAEDLIPGLVSGPSGWSPDEHTRTVNHVTYLVRRYRPRIEGGFARIERWANVADATDVCWRTISADNVTAWYGRDADSRIADPRDLRRIFSWLICQSHDDKGNVVVFHYRPEDGVGVDTGAAHERHRSMADRTANRYLERIQYGNTTPYYPQLAPDAPDQLPTQWHFSQVFDYGQLDGDWPVRADPFSSYRAGFEVRTYRTCRRVLMRHSFPELGPDERLVSDTACTYAVSPDPVHTFLASVTQTGYDHDAAGYRSKSLPPLVLTYQPSVVDPQVHEIEPGDAPNLPYGFDGRAFSWVDLDGEGSAGVLALRQGTWYAMRNLSPLYRAEDGTSRAVFAAATAVSSQPNDGQVAPERHLLLDQDGSGQPDLVRLRGPVPGMARRGSDGSWAGLQPLASTPVLDWRPENVEFADLTGDGLPDLVSFDEAGGRWYGSLGADGFAGPLPMVDALTGTAQPRPVYRDDTATVQFADMSGDGLPDLVCIRNGSVTYRPNLGYGRLGPWVTMDDAPWFDQAELFDPNRVLLADVDGTGTADLVYLRGDGARLYLNRSGNRWGAGRTLAGVPGADSMKRAAVVDLLGSGTACLVWSSPLALDRGAPMRYVDLMGGVKPHLLTEYANSMGAQVRIEYQPSTYFYLNDERDGRPWPTRLPFPVQCAYRVTVIDRVRETVFTTLTSYHDGYYDPVEREFRGFGMVETLDTERFELLAAAGASNATDPELHRPAVVTRTWFHTGAHTADGDRILHTRRNQYYHNPVLDEHPLPEPAVPADLSDLEYRDAVRALKGLRLRSEVYSQDHSAQAAHPYTASESTFTLHLVQPRKTNRYPSFLVCPAESITYAYDRVPGDPRVSHALVVETDELGMVLRSAAVGYPRFTADPTLPEPVRQAQALRHVVYATNGYTNDVTGPDTHRIRVAYDSRSYELTGLAGPGTAYLTRNDLIVAVGAATVVAFEELTGPGLRLRLLAHEDIGFLRDDLTGPLPPGIQQSLGLVDRTYRLALTGGLVTTGYGGNVSAADLAAAGYLPRDGDWWIRSGQHVFGPDARDHFYLAEGYRDAFDLPTTVTREHDLMTRTVTDALGHTTVADNDYRVMGPWQVTDANGNRSAVAFDELGAVTATAVSGKAGEGDTLTDPTSTVEYDLFAWRDTGSPNRVRTRRREQHGPANPGWQEMVTYLDGAGLPVMTKAQAPPGIARVWNPTTSTVDEVDTGTQPRWIGNGRTILDNKGAPVKQYEPYFSTSAAYEHEAALVEVGVTPVVQYDAIGRPIRAELPDGTFTRVEHGAWRTRTFDANDTVADSRWYTERGSPTAAEPEPADPQRRAAWLAVAHADTPGVTDYDSRGAAVLSVADNGPDGPRSHRIETDLTGHLTTGYDTRDRPVASAVRGPLGNVVSAESAERGRRWSFSDASGVTVKTWDAGGRTFRTDFDAVRRPLTTTCTVGGVDSVVGRIVYGDAHPEAVQRNLIGMAYQVYDTSGVITLDRADFRGRPLELARRFATDPATMVDWSGDPEPRLETEVFHLTAGYDALGRPTRLTLPDGTVMQPTFDVANRLASLQATVRGQGSAQTFLQGQEYDAKGRRLRADLGNGIVTRYAYDRDSLRLTEVSTRKSGAPDPVQALGYTYDPVGNITEITDGAQQTMFFANAVVAPDMRFRYDAIYQLIGASGREHASASQPDRDDLDAVGLVHVNDAGAVRRYQQAYTYDDLGNLTQVRHVVDGGGWTRQYRYQHELDPTDRGNRLVATSLPGDPAGGPFGATYTYDGQGNMTSMPQLASMTWDAFDRLSTVDLGGGGTAQYVYSGSGGRSRKVVQRLGGLRTERRYLGGVERYREWMNGTLRLERWTLHVNDEHGRIAQVDTLTVDTAGNDPAPLDAPVVRYQHTNHLGSAVLETDAAGDPISYEEYHPYGTTAYRSARPSADHSLKRYRYAGQERDDETGLYAIGARYYAAWLGRWVSTDPAGFADGPNLYLYCRNNPVNLVDPSGTNGRDIRRFSARGSASEQETVHRLANPDPQQAEDPAFRAEVLRFFQRHGFPQLRVLPTWDPTDRRWMFNQELQSGQGTGGGGTSQAPPAEGQGGPGGQGGTAGQGAQTPGGGGGQGPGPGTGGGAVTQGGGQAVTRNPEGHTLEVPNNFDDEKIGAYRERIQGDRGVGIRSEPPGGGSRTADIRAANQHHVDDFARDRWPPNGRRPPNIDVDHTVELQHIIRRPDETVRPQDHRAQNRSLNRSQGAGAEALDQRQIANGVPEDVPAGGVSRTRDIGRWYNQPRFRTAARGAGYALMVAGPVLTWWGAGSVRNPGVRYGARGLALVEGAGVATYMYGRIAMGGGALGLASGRAVMSVGGTVAGVAGGLATAAISGYMAYEDYQRGDWRSFGFDAAAAVGGVALAVGAIVGSPVLLGIGIVTGVAAGVYHLGRYFSWW
jgi:RHS repeat-associated protein